MHICSASGRVPGSQGGHPQGSTVRGCPISMWIKVENVKMRSVTQEGPEGGVRDNQA